MIEPALIERTMHALASFFCHQLPERSFVLNGMPFPLCARCTGIYTGFLFSSLMFFLAPGKNTQKKPRRTIEIVSFAVILGLAVDGILIKADFYDLSNTARFLFGGLAGIAFYNLILPYLLYFTGSPMATAYFRPIVYGLIFSLFILFYVGVYRWLPHVSIAGLLAFFLSVNLMFSAAISGGRKAFRKKTISPVFIRNVILLISLESILLAFLNNL